MEQTFLMVKPDGVQRGLVGDVISRFEKRGYKLVAMKFVRPTRELLNEHYTQLKGLPFYDGMIEYMSSSGPVVPMVFVGKNIVKTARRMIGETDPQQSNSGTIRGDYGIDKGRNIIHGSDSVESANREINIWFTQNEIVQWDSCLNSFIFE